MGPKGSKGVGTATVTTTSQGKPLTTEVNALSQKKGKQVKPTVTAKDALAKQRVKRLQLILASFATPEKPALNEKMLLNFLDADVEFGTILRSKQDEHRQLSGVFRDVFASIFHALSDLPTVFALSHTCLEIYTLSLEPKLWRYLFAHWGRGHRSRSFPILKGRKEESVWKWRAIFQQSLQAMMANTSRYSGFYRALWDYDASDSAELSFKEGHTLVVMKEDDSGWWTAMNLSSDTPQVEGLVPSNYIESYRWDERAIYKPFVSLNNARYVALFDYTAGDHEELSFHTGDLFVATHDRDGWYMVTNAIGEQGYVPGNYLGESPD